MGPETPNLDAIASLLTGSNTTQTIESGVEEAPQETPKEAPQTEETREKRSFSVKPIYKDPFTKDYKRDFNNKMGCKVWDKKEKEKLFPLQISRFARP